MLPFLKHSKEASISEAPSKIERKPDHEEEDHYDFMEACAEDIIHAVHAKDPKALAEALHAAFELAESMPHEEYEEHE